MSIKSESCEAAPKPSLIEPDFLDRGRASAIEAGKLGEILKAVKAQLEANDEQRRELLRIHREISQAYIRSRDLAESLLLPERVDTRCPYY